jgi:tetratricopeptide (TPR) repeat protein
MRHLPAVIVALFLPAMPALAIDLEALWDFDHPALSEQRFRAALASAGTDDALILRTQIARTYGLRKDFAKARAVLKQIEPEMAGASAEARIRYDLELGRTYSSAAHSPDSQNPETKALARAAYARALSLAESSHLDGLAVDALHMFAFVDTSPAGQLDWDQRALDLVLASDQPAAKAWEASIRNNVGYALYQLGRYEEALAQFRKAVVIRERATNAEAIRDAYWMVAWTLRALHRTSEALDIQLRLEREHDAAGTPDADVFEELELLYRAEGNEDRAAHYAALRKAMAR